MEEPFDSGYFSDDELRSAGFRSLGENVRIARTSTIVGVANIEIGSNVRIDGYCSILAAGGGHLKLGSYVHIAGYCLLAAASGIAMEDFSGLSHGVKIYSRSDDYTGGHLTNPTVPSKFTNVSKGQVTLGRHVIIGSGTVILPRIRIGEGSAVGALSLVTKSLDTWGVYAGSPAKRIKNRSQELLAFEQQLLTDH
jgi:acetyltransferase-like isoleucine patch superfamily enzyme